MSTDTLSTALDGTLERHADGWHWRDGTPAPRVRDMLLSDVSPNFRCATYGGITCVEIPAGWKHARYWPGGRVDADAVREIESVIREGGKDAPIFAEGLAEMLDDHRLTKRGYTVPVALYDAAMREPCGVWWDKADETDILARARALRKRDE